MKAIISGGGTGGHIFPAIAIAEGLKEALPNIDILFVGAEGRMEMQRIPAAGYEIVGLPIAGIQRKLSLKNLTLPLKLWKSMRKATQILDSFQPDVVIGVGGYASGPTLKAAQKKGIPTIVQEQNSYAGLTNKLLSRNAKKICVAYEGLEKYFPHDKIVVTGNPVRKGMLDVEISVEDARSHFGLDPKKKTILVMGGSLGAKSLNEAVAASEEFWDLNPKLQLIWQTGKGHIAQYVQTDLAKSQSVFCTAFLDNMDYAYKASDLIICRAGALTISEVCLLGKASVLVPSPYVAEDHQTKNAQAMERNGAAVMIKDEKIKSAFSKQIGLLIKDDNKLNAMKSSALKMGKPNAVQDIVNIITEYIPNA